MTGATSGVGSAYPSLGFYWGSCHSIFGFMCNVLKIVICPVVPFLLAIVLVPFFDLRILVTPLVSSNSSCWHDVPTVCIIGTNQIIGIVYCIFAMNYLLRYAKGVIFLYFDIKMEIKIIFTVIFFQLEGRCTHNYWGDNS